MLHLRKVIQKIEPDNAKKLIFWLKQREADQCAKLFVMLQDESIDEANIANELSVSPSGYYSLKSRLYASVQEFISHEMPESDIDLFKDVLRIPRLLFDIPRELAITQLLKMEKELRDHDMPYLLTLVYNALKKVYRYSPKYFEYSQLYNKHMAYTMSIHKTQELLSDFNKSLGEYLLSKDEKHCDFMKLILDEAQNYAQLYTSHRLTVYKNIMDIEFALFVARESQVKKNELHEMLVCIEQIIIEYKNDVNYIFLSPLVDFLRFEFCRNYKLTDNIEKYFLKVNEKLPNFLLYNFCSVPSIFLLSKAERYIEKKLEQELYNDSICLSSSYTPDIDDVPNYINYVKFNTIALFCFKKYYEVITTLNELIGSVSFRIFPHAEIEIKLFLSVCYLRIGKTELTDGITRNVKRKLREYPKDTYKSARLFAKILSGVIGRSKKVKERKILLLIERFASANRDQYKMLEYIKFDKKFLKLLLEKKTVL